ncbi:MAG: hypothetical protein KGR99_13910 [Betaproteobacteria bacterium]|nr:hypothetical protein [Betaproteobacteria bacterium]
MTTKATPLTAPVVIVTLMTYVGSFSNGWNGFIPRTFLSVTDANGNKKAVGFTPKVNAPANEKAVAYATDRAAQANAEAAIGGVLPSSPTRASVPTRPSTSARWPTPKRCATRACPR